MVVDYRGVPKSPLSYGAPAGAVRTRDGVLILGEPDVAAYWYPSNDHPRDKATFTIDLTVPAGLKAISNGRFTGRTEAAGRVTWSWEESNPMATYLAMAAIGRFRIHRYDTDDGIPVFDAIDPRVHNAARRALAREERVIRFLARQFGPYPFDALGGVVDDVSIGYALETQTRPIYDPASFNGGPNVGLVVHELAHQWFGNSVSLDEWRHMWLNEGFATYAEWLWTDARGGDTPQQQLAGWCGIPAGDPFWNVTPGDPGKNKLFAFQVYERGAMTLQALRRTVGTRHLLRHPRDVARRPRGCNRLDGTVRPAVRDGVGPGAQRVLRRMALHGGQAHAVRRPLGLSSGRLLQLVVVGRFVVEAGRIDERR